MARGRDGMGWMGISGMGRCRWVLRKGHRPRILTSTRGSCRACEVFTVCVHIHSLRRPSCHGRWVTRIPYWAALYNISPSRCKLRSSAYEQNCTPQRGRRRQAGRGRSRRGPWPSSPRIIARPEQLERCKPAYINGSTGNVNQPYPLTFSSQSTFRLSDML